MTGWMMRHRRRSMARLWPWRSLNALPGVGAPGCMRIEAGVSVVSSDAMRTRIEDWMKQAGSPPGRTRHGFRRHAAKLLAAAGATHCRLMSVMSHTRAMTSEADTKRVERIKAMSVCNPGRGVAGVVRPEGKPSKIN